ncbi:hypothetical protein [Streptomyces montanisoli]|uniref:Uncharacterized protein n=1 Tax=Streptomyces montanisoli TaxID=2798581 RepID=A0A940M7N7_9ACTN|nr:hypothetical protein [Streptomyces montanisoli]MBP0457709.1 hypothetical protein [Streptomyces montanisoli]
MRQGHLGGEGGGVNRTLATSTEENPMIAYDVQKAHHADLLREAAARRLARRVKDARKAAAGERGHGSGRRVRPLQQLFDHAA